MRARRGVTLVEVLVATVLLQVGVGAALAALTGAARLREAARWREAAARAVEARLAWFQRGACTHPGGVVRATAHGIEETWRITRAGDQVRLEGRARTTLPGRRTRVALTHVRRCA